MSLKRVSHSACSYSENTKLTNAMKSSKCGWVVSIELDDAQSVTFESYKDKPLTIVPGGTWPSELVISPVSGTGETVTITATTVPSSKKGRNYWYEIHDNLGNKIDPVIIPR